MDIVFFVLAVLVASLYLLHLDDFDNLKHFCQVEVEHLPYATQCKYKDKKQAAKLLNELDEIGHNLTAHLVSKYEGTGSIEEFMGKNLERRYKGYMSLRETNPLNTSNDTSYTLDKGDILSMCLRTGSGDLEDKDTLIFVYLHELTHIAANVYQHPTRFWELFKVLLHEAAKAELYIPIDYANAPRLYCNQLEIKYNPYFDNTLRRPAVRK